MGTFNWPAASPVKAKEVGANPGPAPQVLANSEIGSLTTIQGKPRFYAMERRGGYPYAEGYFGRNDHAPLPVLLRNNGDVCVLPMLVWEELHSGVKGRLQIVLYNQVTSDEISVEFNGQSLPVLIRDSNWKDPQIFSPHLQPTSGPKSLLESVQDQQLTRIDYTLENIKYNRGENQISIRVLKRGPFKPGQDIKVEKIELHLT